MIYRSLRIGKNGKPFILYKLKTMKDTSGPLSTAADDPRLTKIGKFLRKYKIDELPQIWNVIKGDMNIVGPRPECPEVVALMSREEKDIILSIKPGLVDLATLWNAHEEDRLSEKKDPHQFYLEYIWPTKKRLQIYYIKNRNLSLDLRIILRAFTKILRIPLFKIKTYVEKELFIL